MWRRKARRGAKICSLPAPATTNTYVQRSEVGASVRGRASRQCRLLKAQEGQLRVMLQRPKLFVIVEIKDRNKRQRQPTLHRLFHSGIATPSPAVLLDPGKACRPCRHAGAAMRRATPNPHKNQCRFCGSRLTWPRATETKGAVRHITKRRCREDRLLQPRRTMLSDAGPGDTSPASREINRSLGLPAPNMIPFLPPTA